MAKRVAVVLAAGKGTRMKSELPKVLVPVLGRPMIEYVLDALEGVGVDQTLAVVGYRQDLVAQTLAQRKGLHFVPQPEQHGTGHAVMMCRPLLAGHDGPVVVVTGDSPMVQQVSLTKLLDEFDRSRPACIVGTVHKADPSGLGRVVRDEQGNFAAIVEEKDATDEQRKITEVNMSCYVFNNADLLYALDHIRNDNRQQEYYLTDCPGVLKQAGRQVLAMDVLLPCESLSINNMDELAVVEQEMQRLAAGK
ncbi:MAG: NTP transferase domain-containing protein [Pirellulales bacterium]